MLSLVHHSVNAAQFIKNINKYWGFTSQTSPSLLKKKWGKKIQFTFCGILQMNLALIFLQQQDLELLSLLRSRVETSLCFP